MVNAKVNLLHFLLKQKKHQLMLGGSLGVSDGRDSGPGDIEDMHDRKAELS